MYRGKRFLAIIPARSGSKELIDKNIKILEGKPLIAYTIEAAINSEIFTDIIVSTDSEKYAKISIDFGADVPFIRPFELATDQTSSKDVIIHAINELKKRGKTYDYFMLLQPTSPLRDENDIKDAVNLLYEKKGKSVVSVCEAEHSPLLMNTLDTTLKMDKFLDKRNEVRRQEFPIYYRLNGAIYLSDVNYFLRNKSFYGEKSFAYIMEQNKSIDIDTEIDFEIAKAVLKYYRDKKD